jgi:hypothetical protein
MQERGLRMLHLPGNLLHPDGIGRPVHNADRRSVSAERTTGKGIYQMQLMTHDSERAF